MYFFSLALFFVVLAYIVYANRHSRLIKPKQWLTVGIIGLAGLSYYYGASFYALHYGEPQHDCAIVTENTLKDVGRKRRTTPILYVQNDHKRYQFRYYSDLYHTKFSWVGLKKGDKVCFDYIETLPLARGYSQLLKNLSIQSDSWKI